jgi:cellulose synthase/poly-beta-1,6-N-acetylglucosamine synthase-like glycosyltransferase
VVARIQPLEFERAVNRNWRQSLARGAASGLVVKAPSGSARAGLPGIFQIMALAIAMVLGCALWLMANAAAIAGVITSSFFLGSIWLRLPAVSEKRKDEPDEPEMAATRRPTYSLRVPLFRETRVLPPIRHALQYLKHPTHKLDIKLILEETSMKRALARFKLPPQFEVLVVAAATPQTKPRARNYALHFARGSLLTTDDAEDIPQTLQLRQAARRFANSRARLACLPAELAFDNSNENGPTRQFTLEDGMLFKLMLPSLAKLNGPRPLAGASTHFRTGFCASRVAGTPTTSLKTQTSTSALQGGATQWQGFPASVTRRQAQRPEIG